ncbi:MAG: hypothetical protein QG664_609 [Patescibacteria group bacterium]|nr:hypothetical protein [Patescibacteria group bacterium]
MKNMKNMFYAALVAVLTVPGFALAQWTPAVAPAGAGTLPKGSLFNIISNIMNWLLGLLGVFAIIGFVISGILYLTAAGDEAQQKKAKAQMTWSIIGVLVALAGWVIVTAVQALLGGASTTF